MPMWQRHADRREAGEKPAVQQIVIMSVAVLLALLAPLAAAQTAGGGSPVPAKPAASAAAPKSPATSPSTQARPAAQASRANPQRRPAARRPARPSEAMIAGLHKVDDPLDLKSSVVLVVDQDTDEVLFEKNPNAVLPIASITKLMTAIVTVEAGLSLDETLEVSRADRTIDRVRSNLRPGVELTRAQALQLALMSSENHAAQLLGRTYPGGLSAFVAAMNAKAQLLGMHDSRFADPTGLSPDNRSSPADLVRLVKNAYDYPLIRDYSTAHGLDLRIGKRTVRYSNTNRLTQHADWDIGVQKTGFISAAGRCLVMQSVIEGQRVVMVLLDSVGKYSRLGDAQRIRNWLQGRAALKQEHAQQVSAGQPL
jgi:D-alanyl-D-alanine endopeptidase (penicillin-binding protein 7)